EFPTLSLHDALPIYQSYLQFAITDTGLGISPEDLSKLFKPFSQVGDRVGLQQQGTGLGLAISCQLAQRLGGDITVVSTLGTGSRSEEHTSELQSREK